MPSRSCWRTIRGALLGAGLLMAGCGVSPQPEPPSIDISLLELGKTESGALLTGSPGAVKPGGSTLTALDLDDVSPASSVVVAMDGSFSTPLTGDPLHVYRVQAELDTRLSDPLDVTGVMGIAPGPASEVKGPLAACLTLDPAREIGPLDAGDSVTVTLTSACANATTVGSLPLRLGSAAWSVAAPPLPLVIPASSSASFTVTFDPVGGDARDDILFVQITAPEMGRRPLTLRGKNP
ncbi:Hypothetical protein A7982_00452 [Minicystis rosea]|nr:Hypothetical protein A7982_00452 [Minicystis rosea]